MAISVEVADRPFEFSLPSDWDLGPLKLQGPQEFYEDFLNSVREAEHSVRIRTMFYLPGRSFVSPISEKLKDAAGRGVSVQVVTDGASAAFINQTEVGWPGKKLTPVEELFIRQNLAHMEGLKESGVDVGCSSPLKGRKRLVNFFKADHNKLFTVDSKIAWGAGGLGNLIDRGFTWIDFIAKTENINLVEAMEELILRYESKPRGNYSLAALPDYDFLVDVGLSKSLIFERATRMVEDEEDEVLFISQFLPDGKLLNEMVDKAKHGTWVKVYTSSPDERFFNLAPYKWEFQRLWGIIRRSEIDLKFTNLPCRVHAKGILNSKSSLITSHNLTRLGEWAKVQENGIYSEDPRLRRQLKHFIESVPV